MAERRSDPLAHVPKKLKKAARVHDAKMEAEAAHLPEAGRDAVEPADMGSFSTSDPSSRTAARGVRES